MKKITIVTINYNDVKGLTKTFKSVFNQTFKDFEYVVIDGGSNDGSVACIEENASKINYWVSEKDAGIYNAMNKGVLKANSEYILFINSGDELANPQALENAVDYLNGEDLVSFQINYVGENSTRLFSSPKTIDFSFLYSSTIPHPSTFIKRDLFNKIGLYDEELKIVSDWKFFLEAIVNYKATYLKVEYVLSNFYLDGVSSTTSFEDERTKVLNSMFPTFVSDYKKLNELKSFETTNVYKVAKKFSKYWLVRKCCGFLNKFI